MKEIKISKVDEIEIDYSLYDNVKIEKNSEVYVCINRFLKFQFSEFIANQTFTWSWTNSSYLFGFENQISCYDNKLTLKRKIKPLTDVFLTPDKCYNFPIKELKKILKERKDRKQKDILNKNANAFSFDIFSSIMMEELRVIGFKNVERLKTDWVNKIQVWNATKEHLNFEISEIKLKSVIRKQQELDDNFPLHLDIYGKSGCASYKTTWSSVKKLLPGLLEIKN